jgi:hypothetical protein
LHRRYVRKLGAGDAQKITTAAIVLVRHQRDAEVRIIS